MKTFTILLSMQYALNMNKVGALFTLLQKCDAKKCVKDGIEVSINITGDTEPEELPSVFKECLIGRKLLMTVKGHAYDEEVLTWTEAGLEYFDIG
jgi:hypothetical protein